MNGDHADAVLLLARTLHPNADHATLTGIDATGADLAVTTKSQELSARLPFPQPMETAADLHTVFRELVVSARGVADTASS